MRLPILQKNILAFPLFILSAYSQAVTLDYRHEYLNDDKQHSDRIRVSHRFDNNLSFALEGKWTSKGTGKDKQSHLYDNIVSKGHEIVIEYRYKVNDQFALLPGFVMDSASNSTAYKFHIKGEYKITPKLTFSTRYRYYVKDFDRNTNADSQHVHQGNFVIGYKFEHFSAAYDFEIKKTDYPAWKGKERDYAHNLVVQVPINSEWVPFAELGYVPYKDKSSQYKSDWQWRYRLGIKYNF